MIIFPSRWLAGAAPERKRGDVHWAAWPPDLLKPLVFLTEPIVFANSPFCSQRWLGSCLGTSRERLEAPRKAKGQWVHSSGGHWGGLGGSGSTNLVSIVWDQGPLLETKKQKI